MIANESQERLVKEYLNYKVEDPLQYERFHYPLNEWDNIPPILPRFILTMNEHLKALVDSWKNKFKEEKTIDLRMDLENQNKELHNKIDKILSDQQEVNAQMGSNIQSIQDSQNDLDGQFSKFTNKYHDLATQDLNGILDS